MTTGVRCLVDHVSKSYGPQPALRDVSFEVGGGEVVGVAGPNGAGKSTLARLLLGFAAPNAGRVDIGGLPAAVNRTRFGVGYLPEEAVPEWHCSVRELLALRGPAGGPGPGADPGAVARDLGVEPWMERPLAQLSKGQWRLTLLGYALGGLSPLIVLDEPDSGLDPDALDRLQAGIALAARHGSTVFVLSHNLDELERACTRFLFVFRGQVVADMARDALGRESARETYRRLSQG